MKISRAEKEGISWRVKREKQVVLTRPARGKLSEGQVLACANWPIGGNCGGLCLGVCVEGHQGLSLSPRSEDRSVAMPLESAYGHLLTIISLQTHTIHCHLLCLFILPSS
jgi:hypothetical protein